MESKRLVVMGMKGRMRRYQQLASQDQDAESRNKTTKLLKHISTLPGMSLPNPDSLIVRERDASLTARPEASEPIGEAGVVAPITLVALRQPQDLGDKEGGSVGPSLPPSLRTQYIISQSPLHSQLL